MSLTVIHFGAPFAIHLHKRNSKEHYVIKRARFLCPYLCSPHEVFECFVVSFTKIAQGPIGGSLPSKPLNKFAIVGWEY